MFQFPSLFAAMTANEKKFCIRNFAHGGCAAITYEAFGMCYTQVCMDMALELGTHSNLTPIYVLPMRLFTYVAGLNAIALLNVPVTQITQIPVFHRMWAVTTTVNLDYTP